MACITPSRRALGDLPINTFGTPSKSSILGENTKGLKRPIQFVSEPEDPQSKVRNRIASSPMQVQSQSGQDSRDKVRLTSPSNIGDSLPMGMSGAVARHIEPTQEMGDEDSQHSFNSSTSDFDPDDTTVSQQTAATELSQPLQSRAFQHAQTLRLRLRLAHFKIKTKQTHIPLSQLRISRTESPESSPTQEPSLPTLLPAPILRPTAYSARNIARSQIPSSPPSSPEEAREIGNEEEFRTPALPRHSITLQEATSPPDSPGKRPNRIYDEENRLTSSAVRGNAAIGLLGLMQEQ